MEPVDLEPPTQYLQVGRARCGYPMNERIAQYLTTRGLDKYIYIHTGLNLAIL